jgi:hypothetical protein
MKLKMSKIVSLLVLLLVGAAAVYSSRIWNALTEEVRWGRHVRKELPIEAARVWALSSLRYYSRDADQRTFAAWLTNAPAPLTNRYRRLPTVTVDSRDEKFVCLHLRYGGGMYSWGLTLGQTNLPIDMARSTKAEAWAPGVYFWSN